ncbi:hypothetical protein AC1031_015425 [Aphanomyces cochlioides]|nr:hypothetical protein AC1031_015425 [Aphanomyces cochlioides]
MATVVVDGPNVATVSPGNLRVERLEAAIDYFDRCQVRCIAFAPRYWIDGNQHFQDETSKMKLRRLIDQEKLVLTPPQAHDDFYVIDYATKHDGFVVTNDMFRDHVMHQRRFNGHTLTAAWVKSRCIDFTFVGVEFLPNSQIMDKVMHYVPPSATSTPSPHVETMPTTSPDMEDISDVDMDQTEASSNTRRVVDMSEAVYIEIPIGAVTLLHDNNSAGLRYFEEISGTYMQLPKTVPFGKQVAMLSIHGNRECCERAMHAVHAFLHDYVQRTSMWPAAM